MTSAIIPALDVSDLRAGYGAGDIIHGITFSQSPETILGIIGPNGSGKSTLIKTLAGLVRARTGHIHVTGRDLTPLSPAKRTSAGLAYVPQEANVFRGLTVAENLKLATEFLRQRVGVGLEQRQRVLDMFPDLSPRMRQLAGSLSGGQRQMLAYACALLANPEVLLLDEPSAGLSPKFVGDVMQMTAKVRASGVTVLLVEQNVSAALDIADEVLVLVAGRVARRARPAELVGADLADLFLSRAA